VRHCMHMRAARWEVVYMLVVSCGRAWPYPIKNWFRDNHGVRIRFDRCIVKERGAEKNITVVISQVGWPPVNAVGLKHENVPGFPSPGILRSQFIPVARCLPCPHVHRPVMVAVLFEVGWGGTVVEAKDVDPRTKEGIHVGVLAQRMREDTDQLYLRHYPSLAYDPGHLCGRLCKSYESF
jgi:hypothetical protein